MIVHLPSGGVGKGLWNLASIFVEVAITMRLEIVHFHQSDGLLEAFGTLQGLPRVMDVISERIVIGIISKGPPSCGMYLNFQIFLTSRNFPGISLLRIKLLF